LTSSSEATGQEGNWLPLRKVHGAEGKKGEALYPGTERTGCYLDKAGSPSLAVVMRKGGTEILPGISRNIYLKEEKWRKEDLI